MIGNVSFMQLISAIRAEIARQLGEGQITLAQANTIMKASNEIVFAFMDPDSPDPDDDDFDDEDGDE